MGLFQDSDFAGDFEDSKSTLGGILCILGSHTFVPISWMCKKQTSVSHSLTEAEKIIMVQVLRVDGYPSSGSLEFGCRSVPLKTTINPMKPRIHQLRVMLSTRKKNETKAPTTHDSSELFHVDNVPSSVKFSQSIAMLPVFEDNEAVIKKW